MYLLIAIELLEIEVHIYVYNLWFNTIEILVIPVTSVAYSSDNIVMIDSASWNILMCRMESTLLPRPKCELTAQFAL